MFKKILLKVITVFYTIFVYALCLKIMQYQNALQQAKKKSENITDVIHSILNNLEKNLKSIVFYTK